MITINIASYKRPIPLLKTMESLIDQCDVLNVALNNTFDSNGPVKALNRFFDKYTDKVNVMQCDNTYGDGARYLFDRPKGWLLTVDDDITYPPDYVQYMIGKAKQYGRAIITAHGKDLKPGPRNSVLWKDDRLATYACLFEVKEDIQVELGGTGVMCWNPDEIDFYPDLSRFERKNMADIWVSIQAKEAGIPIIVVAHKQKKANKDDEDGWLLYHLPPDKPTIWWDSFWGSGGEPLNFEMAEYHAKIFNKYMR